MTIKKRGFVAACVLRLDDVLLLTGQGFTKDATLHPLVLPSFPPYNVIFTCLTLFFTEMFPRRRRSTGKL